MGVTGLWSILSELCERKDINYLCDKRVAVDLSGWVVQAIQCKGLNTVKNPHLRNLFCRVSALLLNGAHPVFVLEGKIPDLKQDTYKKRNYQGNNSSDNVSRPYFDKVLNQCHDLLKSLGVPCIKSSGEAEAFCAFLCTKGIVDGVITNDNDALLYGADTVYRDFSIDPKDPHMNMYSLKSEKNKLQLNQQNLIALALLLGCDYVSGVPGVGKEAALKLFKELEGCDLLQRFQDWKQKSESELFPGYEADVKKKETHCTRCSHLGSTTKHKKEGCNMCDSKITCYETDPENPCKCNWHKNNDVRQKKKNELKVYAAAKNISDFPSAKVIEEYMKFNDEIPDEDLLDWQCPDLRQFQDKAFHYLGWTFQHSFEKCFPIITSWQQFKLSRGNHINEITLLYNPIQILKACTVKGEDCLKVQWVPVDGDNSSDTDEENFCAIEFENRFKKSYPNLVDEYYCSIEKSKPQPKTKSKKLVKEQKTKMTDFFSVKTNTGSGKSEKINVKDSEDSETGTLEQNADDYEPDCKKQCLTI
ncbi:flap endonuclease GEN homolog 1-like [Argiope bruennichi]|uniref:flap endonuclease GEN homolog 1-like n=1 Tax=Argiope bruennichi TaxID=94029 RepID=UPI002494127C|nr:flap endonuclease GEN homolog 1-like [Argiope bruennichi]